MLVLLSTTAKSSVRPPGLAGPISRNFKDCKRLTLGPFCADVIAQKITARVTVSFISIQCRCLEPGAQLRRAQVHLDVCPRPDADNAATVLGMAPLSDGFEAKSREELIHTFRLGTCAILSRL